MMLTNDICITASRQAEPYVEAILKDGSDIFATFAAKVVTVLVTAMEESGATVTRDQVLSSIQTQGQAIQIDACSDLVRGCLLEIRHHPEQHFQQMMAKAQCDIFQIESVPV